jgi:hypothetical protein
MGAPEDAEMTVPTTDTGHPQLDGEALARAMRSPRAFQRLVTILRSSGVTDGEIVRAMAAARTVIRPL